LNSVRIILNSSLKTQYSIQSINQKLDFSKRSYAKELLDRDDIPFEDIRQNMKELEFINAHLGGHDITISGLKTFLANQARQHVPVTIAEVGCGGGDNLMAIHTWCSRQGVPVKLVGIDINPHCIDVAKNKLAHTSASFICADYKLADLGKTQPDILFSSLFCHHFTEDELVSMLVWMKAHAAYGFFINDLHRHPVAYYSIKLLSSLFSRSYLVRNDAPLSVLRGFKRKEWLAILAKAGITGFSLKWKWAFRYLLTVDKTSTVQ
jgi:2-polyprenyl-3-methyl-5-hydroxy-6-metoxy-1,4-benzoquinol methylase